MRLHEKSLFYFIFKKSKFTFFTYKLFKSTIKDGKSIKAFNNFRDIVLYLKSKKKISIQNFFNRIFTKLNLFIDYKTQNLGRVKYKLPCISNSSKTITRGIRWILKSSKNRHESNYSLRLANELLDIFSNVGATLEKKKEYYSNFFRDRSFMRFLKYYHPRYRFRPNIFVRFKKLLKKSRQKRYLKIKSSRLLRYKRDNVYIKIGKKYEPRLKISQNVFKKNI